MENIIKAQNWRYATKKFDINKKIDQETLDSLLEALRLSPSSYGLQPWKFIVIRNQDLRAKICKEAAYNQPQITDASEIIIFANKKNINDDLVDEYLKFVSLERGIGLDKLKGFGDMIKGSFSGKSENDLRNWAAHQVYLAVGVLLTSCAVSLVDSCPMEGFDNKKLDELLDLPSLNLESRAIVAIGYRNDDDVTSKYKKVRFDKSDVFINFD